LGTRLKSQCKLGYLLATAASFPPKAVYLFPRESLKMGHDPLFFLAADSTTHITPNKDDAKMIYKA
jgi:hypothetical protein